MYDILETCADCECILDGSRGVYIPQAFAENYSLEDWGITDPEISEALEAGPDHGFYWDCWDEVLSEARLTDNHGREWTLYQDGDLFALANLVDS